MPENKNSELQDKLRVMLALSRECLALKDETDCFSAPQYEWLWNDIEEFESEMTALKADCLI